jgi:hypothetical protein
LRRIFDSFPDNHGREKLLHGCPGTFGPLRTVEGSFTGRAFSPAFRTVFVDSASEHNSPFSGASKTGFEEVDERQTNLAQFDRLDKQGDGFAPFSDAHYACYWCCFENRLALVDIVATQGRHRLQSCGPSTSAKPDAAHQWKTFEAEVETPRD